MIDLLKQSAHTKKWRLKMSEKYIKSDIKDQVGILTIDNPSKLNAMSNAVINQLIQGLNVFAEDMSVRVIIITGAGEKSFTSGGDVLEELSLRKESAYEFSMLGHKLMRTIETCPKPVILAVNGYCVGGGMELAASCDFRIAVDTAKFSMPSIDVGTTCGFGGSFRVPKIIGMGNAKYLMMTGKLIDAHEALSMNLLNAVYPAEEFWNGVLELSKELASKSMYTLAMTKKAINDSNNIYYGELAEQDAQIYREVSESADKAEGMSAFLEKRKPDYKDK